MWAFASKAETPGQSATNDAPDLQQTFQLMQGANSSPIPLGRAMSYWTFSADRTPMQFEWDEAKSERNRRETRF
jgi:hypothetical protein